MTLRYLPDCRCDRPTDIGPEFFHKIGVKLILCDLDNTLARSQSREAPCYVKEWVRALESEGFKIAVVSNGMVKRVKEFSDSLNVPCLGWAMKPFSHKIRRFVRRLKFKPEEVLFIGDQLYTDMKAAKKAGFKAMLCEIISEKESLWTSANRKKDNKARELPELQSIPDWRKYE